MDFSREPPSFLVDELLDIDNLKEKSVKEIHIKLSSPLINQQQLNKFQDAIIGSDGPCSIFFHMETAHKKYTVKASALTGVSSGDDFIRELESYAFVENVWKE